MNCSICRGWTRYEGDNKRCPVCQPADRGIQYANGGDAWAPVHYPDPERVAAINKEWEDHDDREA